MRKILYIIPLIIFAFTFTGGPTQGWYQQFMTDLNGRQITDIIFLDSLTGYAVTNNLSVADTGYILKTTNGGDNWFSSLIINRGFTSIDFVSLNIGYACGGSGGGTTYLCKTTDAGMSWFTVNSPSAAKWDDMSVFNEDTVWLIEDDQLTGGVFRTTNGGVNWIQQGSFGSQNPTKIYMIDGNTGFISYSSNTALRKTTNGGFNWTQIPGENGFLDIGFVDANTGWKATGIMKKTTDGGLSWTAQQTQTGGYIQVSGILNFSVINRDTIWGVGGYVMFPNSQIRAILHRTTNGGANWKYQIPDTSIQVSSLSFIEFTDSRHGWAYRTSSTGIHTKIGGDTAFLSIKQLSSEIPTDFLLSQNYPNPFNPTTSIKFKVKNPNIIKLSVFDIKGVEVAVLVNEKLPPGEYVYTFNGEKLPSGIYFYKLHAEGFIETKKMMLVK